MRRSPRLRCISAAFAWLALAATPAPASPALDAEPTDSGPSDAQLATYRETVERGTTAFVARRFSDARQAFEQAFAIYPDPVLVFNIASCWRRAGDSEQALVEYRRFLTLAPSDDSRRMLAEETIAALEAEPAPAPAPAAPIPLVDPPRPTRSIWRPIGLATTGVGAASVIVGVVELVRARSLTSGSASDASSTSDGRDGQWDGQRDGQWDGQRDGERNRDDDPNSQNSQTDAASESGKRRALLFGAAGVAAMTAGVTMYILGKRSERRVNITASATSSGGQLVIGGRF